MVDYPPLPADLTPADIFRAVIVLRAQGKHHAADVLARHLPPAHGPLPHLPADGGAPEHFSPNGPSAPAGGSAGGLPAQVPQPKNKQGAGSLPPRMNKAYDTQPRDAAGRFADPETHDYACVYLPLPEPVRSRVLKMGLMIPDADLAPDGRETNIHSTVLYGLHDNDPTQVFDILSHFKPVRLTLGKVSVFSSGEHDVLKIEVESDAIRRMNNALRNLPYTSRFRDYKPHCTIGYVKPGLGALYAVRFDALDTECVCPTAVFSAQDGTRTVYPLGRTVTVQKAAMSYLDSGTGGALVGPARGSRKPIKLKRNRRKLMRVVKSALNRVGAASAGPLDFFSPNGPSAPAGEPVDPVAFIFGDGEPEYEKALAPSAKPRVPKPTANPETVPAESAAPAPAPPVRAPVEEPTPAPPGVKKNVTAAVEPAPAEEAASAPQPSPPNETPAPAAAPAQPAPAVTPDALRHVAPYDPQQPDWEHFPSAKSQNRYRNRHTGDIRYSSQPPGGRSATDRQSWADQRAERFKAPAQIASGPHDTEWNGTTYAPRDSTAHARAAADTHGLTTDELVALTGGMPGTRVAVRHNPNANYTHLTLDHPDSTRWSRAVDTAPDGSLTLSNNAFFLRPYAQGSGFGTVAFSNQVRAAVQAGVSRIRTTAGRSGGSDAMNGYYTWPRLGYNADLEPSQIKRLPLALNKARTVLDLYETPEGRAWWKAHGTTTPMTFDVAPGSQSLKALNAYLISHGKPPVEYPPELHAQNQERQKARAANAATGTTRLKLDRVHGQWAQWAREAGFLPDAVRAAAERLPTGGALPPADKLNENYHRAMNQLARSRFRKRVDSIPPAWHAKIAQQAAESGKTVGNVLSRARALINDSSLHHIPDTEAAQRAILGRALRSLHEDSQGDMIAAIKKNPDLQEEYAKRIESHGVPRNRFFNSIGTIGLNHPPALAVARSRPDEAARLAYDEIERQILAKKYQEKPNAP